MKPRLRGQPALEASRVAFLFAIRRDWAPFPKTANWMPSTQLVLFDIAKELESEALALLGLPKGDA